MKGFRGFLGKIWGFIRTEAKLVSRLAVMLAVLALLAAAMILSGPKPPGDFNPFATPTLPTTTSTISGKGTSSLATQTPMRLPSSEYKLTNGVILAVGTVMVIIVVGTIVEVGQKTKKD